MWAAGLDAYDRSSEQHVLWSTTMPAEAARLVDPLALKCAAALHSKASKCDTHQSYTL